MDVVVTLGVLCRHVCQTGNAHASHCRVIASTDSASAILALEALRFKFACGTPWIVTPRTYSYSTIRVHETDCRSNGSLGRPLGDTVVAAKIDLLFLELHSNCAGWRRVLMTGQARLVRN